MLLLITLCRCESLDKVIPGNHSSDTTCETAKSGVGVIPIVIPIVCIAIVGTSAVVYYFVRKNRMNKGKNVVNSTCMVFF